MPVKQLPISTETYAVSSRAPDLRFQFGGETYERSPTYGEVLGSAFRSENITYNLIRKLGRDTDYGEIDYAHDPVANLEDKYRPYWSDFLQSANQAETDAIKARIDEGLRDVEIARRAGGSYVFAAIGAAVLDPVLLPLLALPSVRLGATRLHSMAKVGSVAAAEAAGAEMLLHADQPVRTWQESVAATGGAFLLGSALGSLIGKTSPEIAQSMGKQIGADAKSLGEAIEPEAVGLAVGAAQARLVDTPDRVAKNPFIRKLLHGFSPLTRGLSSRYGEVRKVFAEALEHNIVLKNPETGEVLPTVGKTMEGTYRDFTQSRAAQVAMAIQEGFRELQATGSRMTFWQFDEAIGRRLNTDRWGTPNPAIDKAATTVRKMLDEVGEEAGRLGLIDPNAKPRFAPFYRPRRYNIAKIYDNSVEFVDFLAQKFSAKTQMSRAEILEMQQLLAKEKQLQVNNQTLHKAQQERLAELKEKRRNIRTPEQERLNAEAIKDKIVGTPLGRMVQFGDDLTPSVGPLQERMLALTDEELDQWLMHGASDIMHDYLHSVGAEIALTRHAGDLEMSDWVIRIKREAEPRIRAASGKERQSLQKELKRALEDLEHIRDSMLGRLGPRGHAAQRAANITSNIRGAIFMANLGMMTVAAIPDLARPVAQHGFGAWLKASGFNAKSFIKGTRAYKNRKELQKLGVATDLLLQSRLYALNPEVADMSKKMFKATTTFAKATGMLHWNTAMKTIAANMAIDSLLLAAGRRGPQGLKKLALAGIDEDMAVRINQQFKRYGETDTGMRIANSAKWKDLEAREAFEAAIRRDADTTIVTPGLGDRPIFMSTEAGKFLLQFKSFFLAAHNQMLIPMAQRVAMGDFHAMQGIAMGLLLGTAVEVIRETISGRSERLEDYKPQDWAIQAVDRMGLFSIPMEAFNIADKVAQSRLREMIGATPGSRFFARNWMGTMFGPVGNYVPGVMTAIQNLSTEDGLTESDVRAIRRIMPYQNVFYLRQLLDQGEEALADYYDLPERRN